MLTIGFQGADIALRALSGADLAAVIDEPMMGRGPLLLGDVLHQLVLGL